MGINIIGQRYGKLIVLESAGYRIEPSGKKRELIKCKCDCGNVFITKKNYVMSHRTKSCGHCNQKEIKVGEKYGRWNVIYKAKDHISPSGKYRSMWHCKCDCGNEADVRADRLLDGTSQSCGCLKIEKVKKRFTKHGLYNTRIYQEYHDMIQRCYNPNCGEYHNYGGRSIIVCDEWLDKDNGFMNFYNWAMSHGYRDDLTIDRINVNGNYEPNNCRWAPNIVQSNNTRRNNNIEYDGNIFSLMNWSRALGQNDSKLYTRLCNNWPIHEVLRGKTDNPDPVNAICFIDEYGMPVPQDKVSGDDFVN